ncbi:MAG: hypothetical protein OHK0029_07180 [Armatimonadaceae bacterium]
MSRSAACIAGLVAALTLTGTAFAQNTNSSKPAAKPGTPSKTAPAQKPKPAEPALPPQIAARVGSQNISRDDVLTLFAMFNGQPILDQAIQQVLIEQEAKKLGVMLTEDELQKAIREAKDSIVQQEMMRGTPMTYDEIAAREGFSPDLLRWSVRLQLLRRKAFSKAMESKLPDRNKQVKLAHILIATIDLPTSPNEVPKQLTPEERKQREEEAQKKAETLYTDLKAGKIAWEDAVKESDDPGSKTRKGELDFYGPGVLDPAFEKAGFAIEKPGDFVGPVKSQFGWHIIKLIQKGKDLPEADKKAYRQQQLEQMMANPQVLQSWVASLRETNSVTINKKMNLLPPGVKVAKPAVPATPAKTSASAPAKKPTGKKQ